jgi:hypothetical protein
VADNPSRAIMLKKGVNKKISIATYKFSNVATLFIMIIPEIGVFIPLITLGI